MHASTYERQTCGESASIYVPERVADCLVNALYARTDMKAD